MFKATLMQRSCMIFSITTFSKPRSKAQAINVSILVLEVFYLELGSLFPQTHQTVFMLYVSEFDEESLLIVILHMR